MAYDEHLFARPTASTWTISGVNVRGTAMPVAQELQPQPAHYLQEPHDIRTPPDALDLMTGWTLVGTVAGGATWNTCRRIFRHLRSQTPRSLLRHYSAMPPERLTLDMTVVFDVLNVNEKRPRHRDALALFSLAEWGEVELGIPPQGSLADRHEQFDDELAERLRELASRPGVVVLPQLARLSTVTFPSPDLYPGHHVKGFVKGFDEAWAQAAATWNRDRDGRECPGAADRWYAESHIAGRRDMLVTDDGCLRSMCERLRNEHSLPVRAEGLAEYVARKTGNRA